jgi:predicted nucleic acid-binding Zn ribbon protein
VPGGGPCGVLHTPTGRLAARPHAARLRYGRCEPTIDSVWQELERWGAAIAVVRFSGGSGRPGSLAAVTVEDAARHELARWSDGEGALPDELAAPIWGRYARFRGHPPIVGMVIWDVTNREVLASGTRGEQQFNEVLITPPRTRTPLPWQSDTSHDTSRAAEITAPPPSRVCERCGTAIASEARKEARYCSKLCRQAASRARLRERSGRAALRAPAQCADCAGPMPKGLRPEALYCSKRCRQAASRARLVSRA